MISFDATTAQVLLVVLFALSLGFVAYPSYAAARGWPMGQWASGEPGWISISAFIGMFGALGLSVWQIGWAAALVTLIAGAILGFILVNVLRTHFQWIGILMPVLVVLALGLLRVK